MPPAVRVSILLVHFSRAALVEIAAPKDNSTVVIIVMRRCLRIWFSIAGSCQFLRAVTGIRRNYTSRARRQQDR